MVFPNILKTTPRNHHLALDLFMDWGPELFLFLDWEDEITILNASYILNDLQLGHTYFMTIFMSHGTTTWMCMPANNGYDHRV
jgi:hypothetical protein